MRVREGEDERGGKRKIRRWGERERTMERSRGGGRTGWKRRENGNDKREGGKKREREIDIHNEREGGRREIRESKTESKNVSYELH